VELAARLRRCAQTATASQFTKRGCVLRHIPATPQALRPRRIQKGWGSPTARTSTRAIAALGPARAAQGACARASGAERSDGPYGCSIRNPSVRAEKRRPGGGGCAAGHTRFVYWPTAVVRTERAARSEFRGAPPGRASQVAPAPWRRGRAQQGRLLFGDFLLAKQEKVTAPPGAHPGPRPQHKHAAYTLHAARCIQMLLNK
jgi:hypothetical protein